MPYDLDQFYDQNFYGANLDEGLRMSRWLAPLIVKVFNPQSVMDIGCGCGHYLDALAKCGVSKLIGLEGSAYAVRNAIHTSVCYWDLRQPLSSDTLKDYELAICIEVAEHLEPEYSDTLVDTLCHAKRVLMTAATPGQGGTQHVNEQEWPYWAEKFTQRRFALDTGLVEQMQRGIEEARAQGEHVADWWRNVMVFERM